MMILTQSIAVEALALVVAAATICRLTKLNIHQHRLPWIGVYFGLFSGAVTAFYETWTDGPTWSALLLLLAAALFLWSSRSTWGASAPRHLQK